MNNFVFGRTMEIAKKYLDAKVVTTDKRKYYLLSEPNYHMTVWFFKNIIGMKKNKVEVQMDKPF